MSYDIVDNNGQNSGVTIYQGSGCIKSANNVQRIDLGLYKSSTQNIIQTNSDKYEDRFK